MKERIKKIRKQLGMNQDQFGERLGLARNTIANYEIGRRNPSEAIIKALCREFNVDYLWLTTGEGEMFITSDNGIMDIIDNLMSSENEFAKNTFKAFARLDEKDWKDLERIVKKVLENGIKKD